MRPASPRAPGLDWEGWSALAGLAGGGDEAFWLSGLERSLGRDVDFLQIGAHDGVTGDHLRPFASGIL